MSKSIYGFYYQLKAKIGAERNKGDFYYPIKNLPNFSNNDIKKYFESNFKDNGDCFLAENCVCAVKACLNDSKQVVSFSITSIITPNAVSITNADDKDVWEYLRYDFDLDCQKDFASHPVPHLHIVVQQNGKCINTETRFLSFEPSEYLIYNIIDSIHKMANPQSWWECRTEYMQSYEMSLTTEIDDFVKQHTGKVGEIILNEDCKKERDIFSEWFLNYSKYITRDLPDYFKIPLDARFNNIYDIYNTIL